METLKNNLIDWLKKQLEVNRKDGFVLGISGGVDSCVLTHLLHAANISYQSVHYKFDENETKGNNPVIEYLMQSTNLNIKLESLEASFGACYQQMCKEQEGQFSNYLFRTILKSKLSHIDLSYKASKLNYLVLGTINLDEFMLGYFVKNTCIGDLLPFADIPKTIIRKLGLTLGVPEVITQIKASGCVYGTNAEVEWGVTEEEVYYLVTEQFDKVNKDKIAKYKGYLLSSEHKRNFVPIFNYSTIK